MEFIFFWLQTIMVSYGMETVNTLRIFKELADSGYKINTDKLENVYDKFNLKYATSTTNYSSSKNSKLTKFVPVYNMLDGFNTLFSYNNNRYEILNQLNTLGLIEEMTEFEKKEYSKNPSYLNSFLVPIKSKERLENATRVVFQKDNQLGEIFFDVDKKGNINILNATGKALEMTEEEQIGTIGYVFMQKLLDEINVKENQEISDKSDEELELLEDIKSLLEDEKEKRSTLQDENNKQNSFIRKRKK